MLPWHDILSDSKATKTASLFEDVMILCAGDPEDPPFQGNF